MTGVGEKKVLRLSTKGPEKGPTLRVRDFGPKLWLLCTIHSAIRTEAAEYGLDSPFDRDTAPQEVVDWFSVDLLDRTASEDGGYRRDGVEEEWNSLVADGYLNSTQIELRYHRLNTTVLNRMLGLVLTNDYASNVGNSHFSRVVREYIDLESDQLVYQHVVARCVRGFCMVPEGREDRTATGLSDALMKMDPPDQYECASNSSPESFGLGENWEPSEPKDKEGAALSGDARDKVIERQKRAHAVFRAFCGKTSGSGTQRVYGADRDAFATAALAYYCGDELDICIPRNGIRLFPEHESKKKTPETKLTGLTAQIVGIGPTVFGGSSLRMMMDLPAGDLKVAGFLDLEGRENHISIRNLRITLTVPEKRDGVHLQPYFDVPGIDYSSTANHALIVLEAAGGSIDLKKKFQSWTPGLQVIDVTAPFELDYKVEAPLSCIDLFSEETTPGSNRVPTAREVVAEYFKRLLSSSHPEWTPPEGVPIISNGRFEVNDDKKRGLPG